LNGSVVTPGHLSQKNEHVYSKHNCAWLFISIFIYNNSKLKITIICIVELWFLCVTKYQEIHLRQILPSVAQYVETLKLQKLLVVTKKQQHFICYVLNIDPCLFPKFVWWSPIPQCDDIWGGAFGRWLHL
jgi:hypothetical protein